MRLSDQLREFLASCQGREVSLDYLRAELKVDPNSPAWDGLRVQMIRLAQEKIVKPTGRRDGTYKVIVQVKAVQVFGRERRPPVQIMFPKDFDKGTELDFAQDMVLREGDAILIAGQSNYGKTTMVLNFCAENIDSHPVLMGNEYTTVDGEPSSRFLSRIDNMTWVQWANGSGDNFTLLPVRDDYADHIIKDKINIIDWINLDEHYEISRIIEGMKHAIGKGILIPVIQKSPGSEMGRGGQFTKDFADLEILLDSFGEDEVMLTLGKVKESTSRLSGRKYAFRIVAGVKIINFRELKKCGGCFGKGWKGGKPCDECFQRGYIDA